VCVCVCVCQECQRPAGTVATSRWMRILRPVAVTVSVWTRAAVAMTTGTSASCPVSDRLTLTLQCTVCVICTQLYTHFFFGF